MATPTYDLIEEQVLGSAVSSVTLGSGGTIPQTYKDLVLEIVGTVSASDNIYVISNSDTGANYSSTNLFGDGTTAQSARYTSRTFGYTGYLRSDQVSTSTTQFMSYANGSVYKTFLTRTNAANATAAARVGLWRSTAAITQIVCYVDTSGTYSTGTTFRLWGIA